jgi:hypothetical protein
MTGWVRAWRHRCKTRAAAKAKRDLKRRNHRLNRLVAAVLETGYVRLNGRDVT